MAKIQLKFLDYNRVGVTSSIKLLTGPDETLIRINIEYLSETKSILFDKSTAIKFAKTLRTEINKIKS